jgi:hypothetical protein
LCDAARTALPVPRALDILESRIGAMAGSLAELTTSSVSPA